MGVSYLPIEPPAFLAMEQVGQLDLSRETNVSSQEAHGKQPPCWDSLEREINNYYAIAIAA